MPNREQFNNILLFLLLPDSEQNEIKIVFIVVVYDEKTLNVFFTQHLMTVETETSQNLFTADFLSLCLPPNFKQVQMYPFVFSTPEKGIKPRQTPFSCSFSSSMEKNYIIYSMNKCYQISPKHTTNCSFRNILHFNVFANSVTLFWPESCTSYLMRNTHSHEYHVKFINVFMKLLSVVFEPVTK